MRTLGNIANIGNVTDNASGTSNMALLAFSTSLRMWQPYTGGLTDTITFIDNGGDTNTVVIVNGLITSWTQGTAGVPGEWQFNDQVNSGQILTIGF